MKTRTNLIVALLALCFTGTVSDAYAWGWHKRKSVKNDSVVTSESKYDELVKKAKTREGMFRIHQVEKDWYFEIDDSLMNRDLLIVNKVSGVPYQLNDAGLNKGMAYEDKLIRFHKDTVLNKVWVTTWNPRVSVPEGDAIALSVKDNYREAVIEQFPIEAFKPDSSAVLIKVNKVFDGSEKSFNDLYNSISLGASVKKELSRIGGMKAFPQNIVVKAFLTTQITEGTESVPLTVETTTNIVLLPKVPMTPRFADRRVGFFTTPHIYFNDKQQAVETREFVHRWRLEPKPEDIEKYKRGELVEPAKPIVFYIDPATPAQWREEIKAGVFDWQEAFEAAGFKNAVVAKDAPTDDPDFDIDDARYSVITYAASQQANAMGPSVVDPRSGEIIEADVVWWHNVMTMLHTWMRVQTGPIDPRARANTFDDAYMASAIRFVSSHEVGHTFGLKHNMGASSSFPVDSLRSKTFTARMGGTASSIMDYARFNYVAQPEDEVERITPVIGVYDKFAINWAYRWLDVKDPHEELPVLNQWITKHSGDKMYWYGEQQDPKDPIDPRSQDEDLGDDVIKANRYGIQNLKRIVPNIVAWTEAEGQGYLEAGKLLMAVINQWKMYAGHVTANVGGFYINNPVMGDDLERYVPVEKERQKEAVKYLSEEVFTVPEWLFAADVWKKSFPVRTSPREVEYSPYNTARELQYACFYDLLKDDRLMRMYEAEAMKGKKNVYTPEEMFADLYQVVFKGSLQGRNLSLYERMTQKNFIDAIIVSSNKAVEKTTKKALHIGYCCGFAAREAAFTLPEQPETRLGNMQYSSMGRVSEAVSVKRGVMLQVLKLAERNRNTGNVETRQHYEDLVVRIKEALNIR
ncbi:MAG: zinc-dependent metalloprotease [Odoribacter splanchnicus]